MCESDKSARTYGEAAEWMQRESAYLRRIARLLDTAGTRVASAVHPLPTRSDSSQLMNGADHRPGWIVRIGKIITSPRCR